MPIKQQDIPPRVLLELQQQIKEAVGLFGRQYFSNGSVHTIHSWSATNDKTKGSGSVIREIFAEGFCVSVNSALESLPLHQAKVLVRDFEARQGVTWCDHIKREPVTGNWVMQHSHLKFSILVGADQKKCDECGARRPKEKK